MDSEACLTAPSSWRRLSLADVCERITSGGTPSRRRPELFVDDGWPWVKTKELGNSWVDDTEEHISDEALAASSAKLLPPNTILLAMYGATAGQLGIIRRTMACNQACCALAVDDAVADFRFVYYQLLVHQPQLLSLAVGAAQQNLSGRMLASFRLPYPPLAEQKRIADVLSALDDKIQLNRRMSRTLESIARAIFKSWFVDFDPVRNKMAAGEVGLPPVLAALFPATMVESDFGPVPEGWSFGSLLDVARLNPESWSAVAMPGTIAYVDLTGAKYGRIGTIRSYTAETTPSRARRVLRTGDTIVGTVRPGNSSYALVGETGLTGSTGFAVLRPHEPRYREMVYLAATASDNIEMLALLADGGAYPAVRPGLVAETPLVLAPPKIAAAFSMLVGPMLDRVEASERESRTLIRLRDALLPKLLSGELTPDALLASTATKEAR